MVGWGVKNDLKNRTSFMYVPSYEKSDKDKINVWLKREERSKRKKIDNEKKI
jgi:hypothetical protein